MAWYNWLIVIIPFVFVIGIALYSRRYIRDVVDFLAAGRICGRYVISAAAHEGKMANVLGYWRNGFSRIMILLVAMGIITLMTHANYVEEAHGVRMELTRKILEEKQEASETTRKLLSELAKRKADPTDNGMVRNDS